MGSMICCSSLEGKYEEKDIENDSVQPSNDNIQMKCPAVIQQQLLPRTMSQQTLPPNRLSQNGFEAMCKGFVVGSICEH